MLPDHAFETTPQPNQRLQNVNSEHGNEWKKAADSEYSPLIEKKTLELVKLPKGQRQLIVNGCLK